MGAVRATEDVGNGRRANWRSNDLPCPVWGRSASRSSAIRPSCSCRLGVVLRRAQGLRRYFRSITKTVGRTAIGAAALHWRALTAPQLARYPVECGPDF